jgi:hypothetical protein
MGTPAQGRRAGFLALTCDIVLICPHEYEVEDTLVEYSVAAAWH